MTLGIAALIVSAGILSAEPVNRCSVDEPRKSPGYQWSVERIGEFVDKATVIVRVRAAANYPLSPAQVDSIKWKSAVRFEVLQSIRDSIPGGQLVLPGRLVDTDEFNSRPVPYQMVRGSGQRGDCHSSQYKLGAEYLLLLKRDERGLNVRWVPLAPVNEQVRGEDDPWVQWVRGRASHRPTPLDR